MPQRKKKTRAHASSSTSEVAYNFARFINHEAEKRFEKVKKRNWIKDREFAKANGELFQEKLSLRKWENIGRKTKSAVIMFVQDYYSNALFPQSDGVLVKGKFINLDAAAFRAEFNLPMENPCTFENYEADKEAYDYVDVCKVLTSTDGDLWERTDGIPTYLPRAMFNREARFWAHFVCANLIPTNMLNKVNAERAVLSHMIMTGKPVDAARIMASSLSNLLYNASAGLGFPYIISEIYERAGCPYDAKDAQLPPRTPFYAHLLGKPAAAVDKDGQSKEVRKTEPKRKRRREDEGFNALLTMTGEMECKQDEFTSQEGQFLLLLKDMSAKLERLEQRVEEIHHEQRAINAALDDLVNSIIEPVD